MKKIAALDFEMFNSKYYWSICWAGVAVADEALRPVDIFDRVINPTIREKFIGKSMTLPFTAKELTRYPTFDQVAPAVFAPLSGGLVIGHALENDLHMIAEVCRKYGLTPPDFTYLDTNVCYNACRGQFTEHSLTKLCEEFGIAFTAHNPAEDARASLAVMAALTQGDPDGFTARYGVTPGQFKGGLIRRSYYAAMPEKQRQRIEKYNRVFDAAARLGQGTGKAVYLSNAVATENDLTAVAEEILRRGGRLAADSYCADVTVTNDLTLGRTEYRTKSLRETVLELGLDADAYDYTPKKITGADGKGLSLNDYLSAVYGHEHKDGPLQGETFCFCKAAEGRADYFDLFRRVLRAGGNVTNRMERTVTLVVEKLSDLRSADGRVIAYKRAGSKKVVTKKELLQKI